MLPSQLKRILIAAVLIIFLGFCLFSIVWSLLDPPSHYLSLEEPIFIHFIQGYLNLLYWTGITIFTDYELNAVSWQLQGEQFIKLLAGLTFNLSVLFLLIQHFRKILKIKRLQLLRSHVVVVGSNPKTRELVEQLKKAYDTVVVVAQKISAEDASHFEMLGAITIEGDLRSMKTIHKINLRDACYIIGYSEDDDDNIALLNAIKTFPGSPSDTPSAAQQAARSPKPSSTATEQLSTFRRWVSETLIGREVQVLIHLQNTGKLVSFRTGFNFDYHAKLRGSHTNFDTFRFEFINDSEALVRKFFQKEDFTYRYNEKESTQKLIIIGHSTLSAQVLNYAANFCHYDFTQNDKRKKFEIISLPIIPFLTAAYEGNLEERDEFSTRELLSAGALDTLKVEESQPEYNPSKHIRNLPNCVKKIPEYTQLDIQAIELEAGDITACSGESRTYDRLPQILKDKLECIIEKDCPTLVLFAGNELQDVMMIYGMLRSKMISCNVLNNGFYHLDNESFKIRNLHHTIEEQHASSGLQVRDLFCQKTEKRARLINYFYIRGSKDGLLKNQKIDWKDVEELWDEQSEKNRLSSRRAADFLSTFESLYSYETSSQEMEKPFATWIQDKRDRLAELEHNRWLAGRLWEGDSKKSNRTRWSDLNEDQQKPTKDFIDNIPYFMQQH